MKAYKLAENIYWVGAIDWKLRYFHGYSTSRGSTYNAYLIVDEKITLIDAVKAPFADELLERVASVVDPAKIDYIVSNHVEPDHSGALPAILKVAKNAEVITSFPQGQKGLAAHYGEMKFRPVKTGDEIKIGKHTLQFTQTPMVHWPDNMVTYVPEEGILFSNDAFGQHYASSGRLDTETDLSVALFEAKKYYANIVMPYAPQVKKAVDSVAPLKISMIAPSHGVIWTRHIPEILKLYAQCVSSETNNQALIVYDTMWHSTEKMAEAIADGFGEAGVPAVFMDLANNHISDIMTAVLESKYLALGSPTLNNNILPSVGAFLCYLKGLAPSDRHFIAFGSYGWSGQSPKLLYDELLSCKFTPLLDAPIKLQYIPSHEQLEDIKKLVAANVK